MRKFLGRTAFMLCFFWLGTAYGIAAHGEDISGEVDPSPRAIECSAAFELMSLAAPEWSSQSEVMTARLSWAEFVNTVSRNNDSDAHIQVANEMSLMADTLAETPAIITQLAARCVADAPLKSGA